MNKKYKKEKIGLELIELIEGIVNIKTYSGEEENGVLFLKKVMEDLGYDDVIIDKNGSLIGKIAGHKKGKTILFDGHIDTVKVDLEKWNTDPFSCQVKDGKIIGRGVSDMKAALMTAVYAASLIDRTNLKGDIYVSASVLEEVMEGVAFENIINIVKPDLVVICEASDLNLNIGQRGRAEIVLDIMGKRAHSSNPSVGKNAIKMAMKALLEIEKEYIPKNDVLGDAILEVVDIKSKPYPAESVVPDGCHITFDRRVILNETKDSILKELREILDEIRELEYKVDIKRACNITYTGETLSGDSLFLAWYNNNERLVNEIYRGLKNIDKSVEIKTYSFCTNGSMSAGKYDYDTIGYGPGHESLAHIDNEYIEIDDVKKSLAGYTAIINEFLK